jgi:signal transduction histidine kinase
MQADRLLRSMHRVHSHDLPNQIVALQSLLQMLMEEAGSLSPDGKEYLGRLQEVGKRTEVMVRFLKEMSRLTSYAGKPQKLVLDQLAQEIQGTLQQRLSRQPWSFQWHWGVPAIEGDARTFLQAVVEILCCVAPAVGECRLQAASAALGNQVVIEFALEHGEDATDKRVPVRAGSAALEQRMEIVLAREWLAISGATLDVTLAEKGCSRFTIFVPAR